MRSSAHGRTPLRSVTTRATTRSSGSSMSGITTTPNSRRNDQLHDASAGLLQLGGASDTPRVAFEPDPLEQEEAIERRMYREAATDGDSEDEMEDWETYDMVDDRLRGEIDDLAVTPDEADPIVSGPEQPPIYGAPDGWYPPTAPEGWTCPAAKTDKGEPEDFDAIDNPGGWSCFTFAPKFKPKGGDYLRHCLPTGITPVPENADGKRICNDWEFHYKGWTNDTGTSFRHGATRENLFPEERKGKLCESTLKLLGLNKNRMLEDDGAPDALFFYQLLFPIHDTKKTVNGDPRMPFYSEVSCWSNNYAFTELKLGGGYGHDFKTVTNTELMKWDGTLVMDGACGGSKGAILRRFTKREHSSSYKELIDNAFTKTRWCEIKRVYKLNNNAIAPGRGQPGYDPAVKYDYIYKCLCANVNALTERASLDQCGDETSFPFMGYGPAGTKIIERRHNKPGLCKGGQTVIVSDVDRVRPRAYVHRHSCHDFAYSSQGPSEVRLIWEKIRPLVFDPTTAIDENTPPINRPKAIFSEKPHFTWDNFFSGDVIMEYAAMEGFGLTMTCRRDRLPKGIPGKYLHKEKTQTQTDRTRAARWECPVMLTKTLHGATLQFTGFQSTSSCNFASVNALNGLSLYAAAKERGKAQIRDNGVLK